MDIFNGHLSFQLCENTINSNQIELEGFFVKFLQQTIISTFENIKNLKGYSAH